MNTLIEIHKKNIRITVIISKLNKIMNCKYEREKNVASRTIEFYALQNIFIYISLVFIIQVGFSTFFADDSF